MEDGEKKSVDIFVYFTDSTCQYWSSNNALCHLHNSQKFGNYMNILSAALSLVAVILEAIMFFIVKDLDLYGDVSTVPPRLVEMRPIHRPAIETAIDGKNRPISFICIYFSASTFVFQCSRHFTGSRIKPTIADPASK